MFTFLNTSILMGLIAVSIPIVIHLLTRQKVKKLFFSSLIFLKELQTKKIRRIKIRQILLLLIRTLIILFLILAFARPTVKSELSSAIQSKAKTSAVLLFDNSMSMGMMVDGVSLLEIAKNRVHSLTDVFNVGDEIYSFYVTTGTPPVYDGPRYDMKVVEQILAKTPLSFSSTDFNSALMEAKNILAQSKNVNKEIYLISDLQKIGFENTAAENILNFKDTNIKLFVLPCNEGDISNLSIVDVKPANQIIEQGKVFELTAVIKNFGDLEEKNKLVQLFIDGKRSAQATVNLKLGDSQNLSFKIVPENTGLLTGSVLLEDDDLTADNRRYFSFFVPNKIDILMAGPENKYLNLALELSPNFELHETDQSKLSSTSLENYQIVILSNIDQVDNQVSSQLYSYVEQGGGLILFLGNAVDLKNYNINLTSKFSLPTFTESIGSRNEYGSFLTFGDVDLQHPIFNGMFEKQPKQLESPKFYFVIQAKENIRCEHVIRLSNGSPLLSEVQIGKGRVLLFLTAVDPAWSDLYMNGIFIPLINRSVNYLVGAVEKNFISLLVDQEITGSISSTGEIVNLKLQKPDGSFEKIRPIIAQDKYSLNFNQTNLIGVYSLYLEDNILNKWIVNYQWEESDVDEISKDEFKNHVGATSVTFIESENDIKNDVLNTRFGKELWKYLIVVVLILLMIEMMISRESNTSVAERSST